jgi:hypothetical protein
MFDVIMLLYISLPSWPNINTLCTMVDRERFSVFYSRSPSPKVWSPMILNIVYIGLRVTKNTGRPNHNCKVVYKLNFFL